MTSSTRTNGSLKALALPLQQFLASWGARERPVATPAGAHWPAPYQLAALRGEAVLRQRFLGPFVERLPVTLSATEQVALWHNMVEEGGLITAWVQRLGIAKALRREAALPEAAHHESRQLYTILLDALHTQAPELLPWAVEGYFVHCWKAQFPKTASTERKTPQAAVLRERLLRQLRRKHGAKVELKESFVQGETTVTFSLLHRPSPAAPWQTLLTLERPRLKSARLAAYELATASDKTSQT